MSSAAIAGTADTSTTMQTLSFTGAITESGCESHIQGERLYALGSNSGEQQAQWQIISRTGSQNLPLNMDSTTFNWVDRSHNPGMVAISYQ